MEFKTDGVRCISKPESVPTVAVLPLSTLGVLSENEQ